MIPFKNPLGKPPRYTPEALAEKFAEFVQWCQDNPIEIIHTTTYANGNWSEEKETKPRLISLAAFELYAGVTDSWWANIVKAKRGDEYLRVKANIKKMCENYQKEMASAGLFKENIVSRMLGLKDKQEVEQTGEGWKIVVNSEEEKQKIEGLKDLDI